MSKKKIILEGSPILESLVSKKIHLLRELNDLQNKFNSLAEDVSNADEWIHALPSLKSGQISKLQKVKLRQGIRKEALNICKELDTLEIEVRIAQLDILSKKIESMDNALKNTVAKC